MSLPSYLTSKQRAKCHQLGVDSERGLYGLLTASQKAAEFLGPIKDKRFADALALGQFNPMMEAFWKWVEVIKPTLNFLLLQPDGAVRAPEKETTTAKTPKSLFLKEILGAIRDQQNRGTCVSFASIASIEAALTHGKEDLSEQLQYYFLKNEDGMPHSDGSWVHVAFEKVFMKHGVAPETLWPYNPSPTNDPGQGPAPEVAVATAAKNKPTSVKPIEVTLASLKAALVNKKVIAFGIPVYESSMRNPEVKRTGKFVEPVPGESPLGGHAMAIVGYMDDTSAPGGGYFIIRNSWGTDWAYESPNSAGYGKISYAYFLKHGRDCWTVTK